MSVLSQGSFSLNLGFIQIGGELTDDDRQCAWELYTEIVTRVSVYGKIANDGHKDFDGELYDESFSSLYSFFKESRLIMRKFPVGKLEKPDEYHLGKFICSIMTSVLRPFLEKWQGKYRYWWNNAIRASDKNPYDIQKNFPDLDSFLSDWADLRYIMRNVGLELASRYKLVQIA